MTGAQRGADETATSPSIDLRSAEAAPSIPALAELDALVAHRSLGLLVASVREYAIFSLDPAGVIQTWNVGAQRIKGYTEHEIVGRHFSIFYLPEDRQTGMPEAALADATAHGQWSGSGWRVRKDNTRFWANVVITAVFDHVGDLRGFVKLTSDETDRGVAHESDRRLDLMLERERIALALSDTTVRGIFDATLALDSALAMTNDRKVAERIRNAIAALDGTLAGIRSTVNGLKAAGDASPDHD